MGEVIKKSFVPGGTFVKSVEFSFKDILKMLILKLKGKRIMITAFSGEEHNEYTLYVTYQNK